MCHFFWDGSNSSGDNDDDDDDYDDTVMQVSLSTHNPSGYTYLYVQFELTCCWQHVRHLCGQAKEMIIHFSIFRRPKTLIDEQVTNSSSRILISLFKPLTYHQAKWLI